MRVGGEGEMREEIHTCTCRKTRKRGRVHRMWGREGEGVHGGGGREGMNVIFFLKDVNINEAHFIILSVHIHVRMYTYVHVCVGDGGGGGWREMCEVWQCAGCEGLCEGCPALCHVTTLP